MRMDGRIQPLPLGYARAPGGEFNCEDIQNQGAKNEHRHNAPKHAHKDTRQRLGPGCSSTRTLAAHSSRSWQPALASQCACSGVTACCRKKPLRQANSWRAISTLGTASAIARQ